MSQTVPHLLQVYTTTSHTQVQNESIPVLNTVFSCISRLPSPPLLTPPPFLCPDVEQMAIDWLTGNFYFVDDVDDRIFVCDKDGQTCVTLLDQELYNPKGIALDPTMGSV